MPEQDAVRITTAQTSAAEDLRARQRRYALAMGIRTVCFIAAVVVGAGWLRWVLIANAVFLPFLAVVIANAGNQKDDGFRLPESPGTPELGASRSPADQGI